MKNKLGKVVGFCGLAGSGKNEAANAVLNKSDWFQVAFASAMKECARVVFGWNGVKDQKGRALLQEIGMAGRKYNPDVWIQHLSKEIALLQQEIGFHSNFAITDVRFDNEAEFVKRDLGGIIIRILNPNQAKEKFHAHVSECEQWKIHSDYIIVNDGTKEDLHNNVLKIINHL